MINSPALMAWNLRKTYLLDFRAKGANLPATRLTEPTSEVQTRGETSMMFFGGDFSHAVVKRPKPGSILVQAEFSGVAERTFPPEWAIAEGRRLLSLLPEWPHYARVDAVILDESLLVMEVELIEPELFFTHDDAAAGRLAAVLMQELEA